MHLKCFHLGKCKRLRESVSLNLNSINCRTCFPAAMRPLMHPNSTRPRFHLTHFSLGSLSSFLFFCFLCNLFFFAILLFYRKEKKINPWSGLIKYKLFSSWFMHCWFPSPFFFFFCCFDLNFEKIIINEQVLNCRLTMNNELFFFFFGWRVSLPLICFHVFLKISANVFTSQTTRVTALINNWVYFDFFYPHSPSPPSLSSHETCLAFLLIYDQFKSCFCVFSNFVPIFTLRPAYCQLIFKGLQNSGGQNRYTTLFFFVFYVFLLIYNNILFVLHVLNFPFSTLTLLDCFMCLYTFHRKLLFFIFFCILIK